MREEIKYLTDIFYENGHYKKTLQKIINGFEKETCSANNKIIIIMIIIRITSNKKPTVIIPWVPKIGPKTKKEIKKFGFRAAFQTNPKLKNILCKNKDKLLPNSYPGVYQLKCSCGSKYNGEIRKLLVDQ